MPEKKRIRYLGIALVVLGIQVLGCNLDPQVRKQKYFDSAMTHLRKGDPAKAVLDLRNALQVDPNFAEAANVLAELYARSGNYRSAYVLLEQVEKNKPDYLPARRGMAQLYKIDGKLDLVQEEINYILDHNPDDTEALFLLGSIQVSQKKSKDAEGTFNRILEIQPSHIQALLALASLQKGSEQAPQAEHYLKLALDRNPRSQVVYLSLFRFYLGKGRHADAEALFPQAAKMTGNNIQVLEAEEGFYVGSGKLAQAEEVARKIRELHATDRTYWSTLADYYVQTSNWRKAKEELQQVLAKHKDDVISLRKLIEVELNLGDVSDARKLNEDLLKRNPKDSYAHLFNGRLYLAHGDVENALLQFNETQKYQPNYAALYYWYAQAYLNEDALQQAEASLGKALKYNPGFEAARLQLAELQNQTGAPNSAMYNARWALARSPGDTHAMLVYSQALIQKQEYADAAKVVAKVAELSPDSSEVHRQLGILALIKKDEATAQKEFNKAWSLNPQSRRLLEATLLGYLRTKQIGPARDFLQHEIQTRPNDPLLYHELAQVYLLAGKQNEAISALQKALSFAPGNVESTSLLADTYISAKQPEQALRLITEMTQKHAQDTYAMLRAGMLLEKLEHWEEAKKAYQRAIQIDMGNAIAKNNLAWLLASHGGDIAVALSLAEQAKEQLADNVQVTSTLAWIYYKEHAYKTAMEYLKQCVAKDQKNASYQYQLGLTYFQLGNTVQARQTLLAAIALDPHSPNAPAAWDALASLQHSGQTGNGTSGAGVRE